MKPAVLGPLLPALILAGCVMFGFGRRLPIPQPPAEYASGPTLSGHTVQLDLPLSQVMALCKPDGSYAYDFGCYLPNADAVVVPAKGEWPSEAERQAVITHEWGHARGWRHDLSAPDINASTSPASIPSRGIVNADLIAPAMQRYPDLFSYFQPNDPGNPAPTFVGANPSSPAAPKP